MLCMWEVMLFCALEWALRRPAVSASVTYILVRVVTIARSKLGQSGMSKASLIDDRFLV